MTRSSVRITKPETPPSELQIITKIEAMITYCHLATGQFPKSEKPAFGRALRDHGWDLLEQVVICNKKFHKKDTMQKVI